MRKTIVGLKAHWAWVLIMPLTFCLAGCANGPRPNQNPFRNFKLVKRRQEVPPAMPVQPNAYGYLQEGPVFAGSQAVGPPGQTATERAMALEVEVEQLRIAKATLEQDESTLKATLASREEMLARAEKELGATKDAMRQAHRQISDWQTRLSGLHERVHENEQNQRRALDEIDQFVTLLIAKRSQPTSTPVELPVIQPPVVDKASEQLPLPEPEPLPEPTTLRIRGSNSLR